MAQTVISDLALAKEAVSLPNWAWERGMVLLWGRERPLVWDVRTSGAVTSVLTILSSRGGLDAPSFLCEVVDGVPHWKALYSCRTEAFEGPIPDLSHPCTLALVRERIRHLRGDSGWTPLPLWDGAEEMWLIEAPSRERQTRYGSEGAAMVAALRALA
jgi:hypothetical protein